MEILIQIAQLILGISILVGLHELGHMLAAKYFGMRVEKFSIGFPPKIASFTKGETEYSIGAIPLGGFVKITGMVDESLDTEMMNRPPEPHEFRAKPAWQRLIVMMAGIIMNILLGIAIYIGLTYSTGDTYISAEEVNKNGIYAYELGREIGFQDGDKIVDINGKPFKRFADLYSPDVLLSDDSYISVERDGEIKRINLPSDILGKVSQRNALVQFVDNRDLYEIGQVMPGGGAAEAGLLEGDKILAVDGESTKYFVELSEELAKNAGQEVELKVERNGEILKIPANISEDGKLGFYPVRHVDFSTREYSLAEAIPIGTERAFTSAWDNIRGFGKIFSGDVPMNSLMGPIGITQIFSPTWDWVRFWSITGMLSMWLAFLNFLPIPALDGGHVAFLTYEMVSGRSPNEKFLENAQKVGMVILLSLMVFVVGNDIFNILF